MKTGKSKRVGRGASELRPITIERGIAPYAEGSCLISFGATRVLCTASVEEGVPAFLTLILIPLTFSITQGILWGFISHVGLYLMVGRRRDIHPVMYALAVVSIGLLVLERVKFG